ncbi:MAG: VOC family protein [Planctomycetota bacterium]
MNRDNQDHSVECLVPVLGVTNLRKSLAFYTQTLGFTVEWGDQEGAEVCGLRHKGHALMLSEHAQPGGWVWIGLPTDAWFESLPDQGVEVIQPPTNNSWAYEMKLADPDGNVLWLGTGPKKDQPFHEW